MLQALHLDFHNTQITFSDTVFVFLKNKEKLTLKQGNKGKSRAKINTILITLREVIYSMLISI